MLGTRDYVAKNGFTDAVIGLSGGIDSSLVAAIAVDALGPEHVHGVTMPSRYSSEGSVADAVTLAANLGIDIATVPIEAAHRALASTLAPLSTASRRPDRREPPVAHPGRAAHGPVQRQRVDRADHRQQERDGHRLLDPLRRLRRRVRGDQGRAQDPGLRAVPLPQPAGRVRPHPRPRADQGPVGRAAARSAGRRVAAALLGARPGGGRLRRGRPVAGRPGRRRASTPRRWPGWWRLVDRAEYKRRQMPPGVRISGKAFGKDRRMPITNHYRSDRGPAPSPVLEPAPAVV